AFHAGQASGDTPVGRLTLERFGSDPTVLFVTIAPLPEPSIQAGDETAAPDAPEGPVAETATSKTSVAQPTPHAAAAPPPAAAAPPPASEAGQPLRFVWQIDEAGRFTVTSDAFMDLLGAGLAATLGRPWTEVAAEFGLDPDGRLAAALTSHDTFSAIMVTRPIEGTPERLQGELSGLPVFDRARAFHGFRGFGICRDVERLAAIAAARRAAFVPPRPVTGAPEET